MRLPAGCPAATGGHIPHEHTIPVRTTLTGSTKE